MKLTTSVKRALLGLACVAGLALLLTAAEEGTAQDWGGRKAKKGKKAKADVVEVDLSKLPPELARAVRRYVEDEGERGAAEEQGKKGFGKGWKGFEGKKGGKGFEGKWKGWDGFGKGKKGFGKGIEGKESFARVITVKPGERVIIEVAGDGVATERREWKGPPAGFGKKKGKRGGEEEE
jgi:hypothetical protein